MTYIEPERLSSGAGEARVVVAVTTLEWETSLLGLFRIFLHWGMCRSAARSLNERPPRRKR